MGAGLSRRDGEQLNCCRAESGEVSCMDITSTYLSEFRQKTESQLLQYHNFFPLPSMHVILVFRPCLFYVLSSDGLIKYLVNCLSAAFS